MARDVLEHASPVRVDPRAVLAQIDWRGYAPAALIASAFLPLVILFTRLLLTRPNYQFVPWILPGAAVLAWRSCRGLGALDSAPWAGRATLVCGWLALALGVAFVTPWFGAVGALVTLLGAALTLGGGRLARAVLPAWGFLWVAIPLPRSLDEALVIRLQSMASRWSSQLLDALGIFHVMDGNVVTIGGHELFVDQACSGISSLMTLMAGTVFYLLWAKTPPLRALVLLAGAVFWVLVGNVLRIVGVVLLAGWGIEAATGWRHEALGLIAFVLMLAMVVSTDRLAAFVESVVRLLGALLTRQGRTRLRRAQKKAGRKGGGSRFRLGLWSEKKSRSRRRGKSAPVAVASTAALEPEPAPAPEQEPEPEPEPAVVDAAPIAVVEPYRPTRLADVRRTWLGSWPVAAAFGLLLLPQGFLPGSTWGEILAGNDLPTRFTAAKENALPDRIGAYRRVGFRTELRDSDSSWGEHSRVWTYQGPAGVVVVSLDYAFVGWHDLIQCYLARGWVSDGFRSEPATAGPGVVAGPRVVAELRSTEGLHGSLIYALHDRHGRPLALPGTLGMIGRARERLASWLRRGTPVGPRGEVLSYQVQVFVASDALPPQSERSALLALFETARERIGRLAGPTRGTTTP